MKNWKEAAAGRPSPPVTPSRFCRFLGIFCGAPRPLRGARWPPAFGWPPQYGTKQCLRASCRRRRSVKPGSRPPGRWAQLVLRFQLPVRGAGRRGFAWPAARGLAAKRPVLRFGILGNGCLATSPKNGAGRGPVWQPGRGAEGRQPTAARAWVPRIAPRHGVALATGLQRRPCHEYRGPTFSPTCISVFRLFRSVPTSAELG